MGKKISTLDCFETPEDREAYREGYKRIFGEDSIIIHGKRMSLDDIEKCKDKEDEDDA